MGVLQDFERRLEGAVEGFFARAFRSGLQPVELAKALQRYAEDNQHVTADGVVVPNVYRIHVSPRDHDRLSSFGASLPRELAEVVVRTSTDRGWSLRGPVKVRIEALDEVRFGMYDLAGRVEVVDPSAPSGARLRGGSRAPSGAPASAPPPTRSTGPPPGLDQTQVVTHARATLQLRIANGPGKGTTTPLTGQRVTLGRLNSCTVTLDDSTVSREHAALVRRGETWWVVDLNSTNGTSVNGVHAAEQPVAPGDRIELGDAVVELVEGRE
ncbi:FhaA domain-containing protein [Egicoccus sp. AB-alg2]|uniref:FhaA domain-containing protein n=1 Tax=Egicoccus sp. AB-alg2 TaxID=3242693 RepID=UPI00359E16C6